MSFNLTTSGACIVKAGENADSTITSSFARLEQWCDEEEGIVSAYARRDLVNSPVTGTWLGLVENIVSSGVAMKIVRYNMAGYTSRTEAQTILDALYDEYTKGLDLISRKEIQEKFT